MSRTFTRNPRIDGFARALRAASTPAERRLWFHLREHKLGGHTFRRQHPLGPYIVDFICLHAKLVIELDGAQHADLAEQDAARTRWLEARGYRVHRIWNGLVFGSIEGVLDGILDALGEGCAPRGGATGRRSVRGG